MRSLCVNLLFQAAHLHKCARELLQWPDLPRVGRKRPEDDDALCVWRSSDSAGQWRKEEDQHAQQKEIQRWPVAHGSYVKKAWLYTGARVEFSRSLICEWNVAGVCEGGGWPGVSDCGRHRHSEQESVCWWEECVRCSALYRRTSCRLQRSNGKHYCLPWLYILIILNWTN